MRKFFAVTCLLAIVGGQALAAQVDFKTHYLARTPAASDEFRLLLRLFQTQLDTTLASSYYHRYLLHSLLAIPPRPLPALLVSPVPLTALTDTWAEKERLPRHTLWHNAGSDATQDDEHAAHHLTHRRVRAVLQVLWEDSVHLQQLLALAQRMPIAQQYGETEQRQAIAVLKQLAHDEQRQQRVQRALIAGGAVAAAVLLAQGVLRLNKAGKSVASGVRALWSKRVLGMHVGYSLTIAAALYPAWQLGKAVKRRVQRRWQTPADLRQHSDYRIAYFAFLSHPHNLQRQQAMLHTLNRCLQKLHPLFAEREITVKVNTQHNRYHHMRQATRLTIAVPYTASNDVPLALRHIITHYYDGKLPPSVLPQDIKYCRRDRA